MKADLHNHTKNSDGILTVGELAKYKYQQGFDMIAITDHDSILGYHEIQSKLPIPVLLGVELSTYYQGENIHLLGYFKKNEPPSLEIQQFLENLVKTREERVKKMIQLLKNMGIEIQYDSVKKYADGVIGRPHIAKAIQEKYKMEWRDIFDRYIGDDAPCYVKTFNLDLKDAIELLHKNNALAVLAHPHYILKNDVEKLISLGIDGIEVYYPTMNEKDRKKFLKFSSKHHLFVTGGSDFHEEKVENKELYDYGLKNEELDIFLQKLGVKENDRK